MLFVMLFLLLWVFMLVPREGLFVIHFKVLYPGALNGLCLARKNNSPGVSWGSTHGEANDKCSRSRPEFSENNSLHLNRDVIQF